MRYVLDKEHNVVEIYFDSCPASFIREKIKANGYRWRL